LPILDAFQMLPLNYAHSTNTLYLAFGERVDHAALYAIEKILECRTLPCVAGRESIARQLEGMRQFSLRGDVEFGPMSDLTEMARIASSYTARLSPGQVRLSRVGRFIWLRLDRTPKTGANGLESNAHPSPLGMATNLIFRLANESPRSAVLTRPFRDLFPVRPSTE
jgi:hypothetical protein